MDYNYYKGLYSGIVYSIHNSLLSDRLPDLSEDDYQFIRYLDECLTDIIVSKDMLWTYRSESLKYKLYHVIQHSMFHNLTGAIDMDVESDRIIGEWMMIRRGERISSIME